MIVDASRAVHIPAPIPLGPYTVVRGRSTVSVSTNSTGQYTVLLLGPHTISSVRDACVTPVIAVSGVGMNVPGTAETIYSDGIAVPYAASLTGNLANGNLHGLTIVLNCLSTATQAEGQVFLGSLNQRINRTRYSVWNDVAIALLARREVQPHSAYNVLSDPIKASCYPVDIVDWAKQSPLVTVPVTSADNITMDSLSQLVMVFPPTTAILQYSVTVYTEWRMNFTDAALASTATTKRASSMDLWSKLAAVGSDTSGFLQAAGSAVLGAGTMDNLIKGANTLGSVYQTASKVLGIGY